MAPLIEGHPPWNLSFKEPSSLVPLGAERWLHKSGHPRDLWIHLSQDSLLMMLLWDTYPIE